MGLTKKIHFVQVCYEMDHFSKEKKKNQQQSCKDWKWSSKKKREKLCILYELIKLRGIQVYI